MNDYAVRVITSARLPDVDQLDELVDALAPYAAALGEHSEGTLSAQMTVQASDLHDAGRRGAAAVEAAMADLGITGETIAVEVMTDEAFQRWLDTPQRPEDLVSTSEAAVLLGVSRQRVLQLAETHPDFPPAIKVGNALLRSASALRRFAAVERRSGRPASVLQTAPDAAGDYKAGGAEPREPKMRDLDRS